MPGAAVGEASYLCIVRQMLRDAASVAQARPGGPTARRPHRDVVLAVGIEGVVDGRGQPELFLVVGRGALKATDEGVETWSFRAAGATWRHIGIADDPPQLDQS